jgi:hypothetical protein
MINLILNGKNYDPVIDGDDIHLIGLDEMIILVNANPYLEELAESESMEYTDGLFSRQVLNKDLKQDYILNNLVSFCEAWVKKGNKVEYEIFNNN